MNIINQKFKHLHIPSLFIRLYTFSQIMVSSILTFDFISQFDKRPVNESPRVNQRMQDCWNKQEEANMQSKQSLPPASFINARLFVSYWHGPLAHQLYTIVINMYSMIKQILYTQPCFSNQKLQEDYRYLLLNISFLCLLIPGDSTRSFFDFE